MTERKPADMTFETWVDKAIREAEEAGKFADLPGTGKPIPGAGKPDDELWWVKAKLEREKLAFVPPSLALRKEVEEIHELAATKQSEAEVRALVDDLNRRLVAAIRTGISGPRIALMPVKADQVLATWREHRAATTAATGRAAEPAQPAAPRADDPPRSLRRWLFRRRQRS
ncbi:MAG: DUF1992 domain-containing protein [Actinomycetota bacterium]|nr:DUF1992 domain-containing protein [Actinomycetota bacterium]